MVKAETPSRILVVDDQEDNRIILQRRLVKLGYAVETAQNGREALELIARRPPDLVLLDYMMPGMTGPDVLRQLRADHDGATLPVIMVTARSEDHVVVECIEAGANDYISKPISFSVLYARARAQLERQAATVALQRVNEELEARVAERTRELISHNEALRKAHVALEKSDRAKSLYLASMSHEMRTPLNSVIGLSELVQSEVHGPVSPSLYMTYISEIRKSGSYLLELVDDIIESIEATERSARLDLQAVDVADPLSESISMANGINPDGPSRIRFDRAGQSFAVTADPSRLRHAFSKVLGNALKYSPAESDVTIEMSASDGHVEIHFIDAGRGIAPEKIKDVLTPFIQLYNVGEAKQQGLGLGLSIAQEIIRQHGGMIAIANRAEGGLCVTIRLPLSDTGDMSAASGI